MESNRFRGGQEIRLINGSHRDLWSAGKLGRGHFAWPDLQPQA